MSAIPRPIFGSSWGLQSPNNSGSPKVRVGPKLAERVSRRPEMRGFVTGEVAATARTEKPPIIRLLRPDEEAATRAHDDVTEKASGNTAPGSSHKCVHDLAPGRSATAVGRRCGCARARYATAQSSVAQSTAACAGPALGGGPARRQPDQTQAADSMALTRRRTVKDRRTQPRLSPTFYARAEPSLTVQPRWNWQPRHDSAACCGRTFREPATPLQIQTVFFSHVSH